MTRCPEHAAPEGTEADAWPCPDDCLEFLAELDRRIVDVQVNGNFTRMFVTDGVLYRQVFRDHRPVGEPEPMRTWKLSHREEQ